MSQSGKHRKKKPQRSERAPRRPQPEVRAAGTEQEGRSWPGRLKSWFSLKNPVFRFVLVFTVLICGFNAYFALSFTETDLFDSYLQLNAKASAVILSGFGEGAEANGTSVSSKRFSLSIKRGCDAIQASAFFVFAVLASPVGVPYLRRLVTVLIGTVVLLAINMVRIISLYYTGVHWPSAFETMHVEVWQAGFIFLPIFFWLMWVRSAIRRETVKADVST